MNDEEGTGEHRDAFEAFQLRFRFENHAFTGLVWKSLREAGWSHDTHNLKYKSPNGTIFQSARDVMIYLDQCAIPEVRGNLDVPERPLCSIQLDDSSKALRERVMKEVWEHSRTKETELEDTELPPLNSRSLEGSIERSERKQGLRRPTQDRGVPRSKPSTATTETGTDLYLQKHSKTRRKEPGKKRQQLSNERVISTESLVVPSIEDCRKTMQGVNFKTDRASPFRDKFATWRFLLSTNHPLLFYGAGSKYHLLNAFAEEELDKEGYVLVIKGFEPDVSMEEVLDLLVGLFLNNDPEPLSRIPHMDGYSSVTSTGAFTPWTAPPLVERAIRVGRALAKQASDTLIPTFLVIHSLEGLGSRLAQEALAAMLVNSVVANGVAAIRLVASVDHVDAPTMWNTTTTANFSWIYQKVHTYQPYGDELIMLPKSKVRRTLTKASESNASQRALEVLRTLAPRHAEVVQILARLQLDGGYSNNKEAAALEHPQPVRIAYANFLQECKAACAVNKDAQLRSFMSELQDHGLLEFCDGWVRIPFDKSKLKEFVAYRPERA